MDITELNQRFPDLQKSLQALQRAGKQAKHLAEQTGTPLVVGDTDQREVQTCLRGVEQTLGEWSGAADEAAYRDLSGQFSAALRGSP